MELRRLLEERGLAANHGLGQNFLLDPGIIEGILDSADPGPEENVLEIGPGPGILTEGLLERAGRVFAVELDRGMCVLLTERFAGQEKLTVLHQDILKTDLTALLSETDGVWKVVANLPYYITTPVLFHLLSAGPLFSSITVMMQKEVAERLKAAPGEKSYGALSLAVQYSAKAENVLFVPPEAFWPRPKVESMVVRLIPHKEPPVPVCSPENLFRIIRAAFGKRRKTLPNALEGVRLLPAGERMPGKANRQGTALKGKSEGLAAGLKDNNEGDSLGVGEKERPEAGMTMKTTRERLLDKKTVEEAMKACGLDPRLRGETLSLESFAELADMMSFGDM